MGDESFVMPSPPASKAFHVGAWRVHPDEGLLERDGEQRRIQPKVMDVLLCLARQPGELMSREEILHVVWGERAVSDEPLTRCIAELRSAFDDQASNPAYIETLPKRGYRLIAPVQPAADATARPPGRAWLAVLLLLVMVALAWAWWSERPQQGPDAPDSALSEVGDPPVIAVLPFVNLEGSDEQDYLSDGLTETLTQVLARQSGLAVVARSSAFAFKDAALDVRDIGARLGVDAVLEGSVQREGDELRITARLVDAHQGVHLWADAYDRRLEGIFEVQDDIAAEVTAALRSTLLDEGEAQFGARDPEAWLLYARGLDAMRGRSVASMESALDAFRRAVERDPSFALGWLALGDALVVHQWYADVPLEDALSEAERAVETALDLDPGLAGAHALTGRIAFRRGEYEDAEAAFKRAVALAPGDADAWFRYGTLLNGLGRAEEALDMHRRAVRLDPLSAVALNAAGVSLEKLGRFDEALEQYRTVLRVHPDFAPTHDRLGLIQWNAFGRADLALAAHREALALDPASAYSRTVVSEMMLDLDDQERASEWAAAALEQAGRNLYPNLSLAYLQAFRGDEPAVRMAHAERWLRAAATYADVDAFLRLYRDAALQVGDLGAALALYRERLPGLFEPGVQIDVARYGPAIDLALLLQLEGAHEQADRLLERAWQAISELPRNGCCGHGLADVEVLALSGRGDEAMATLQQAYDSGYRMQWWWHTRRNPNLASLEDREDYQALLRRFVERAAQDRARLPADAAP